MFLLTQNRKDYEPIGDIDIKCKLVGNGSHFNEITVLETCLQRPILLTCSVKDQTVCIWDYISHKQVLCKPFGTSQDKLTCASLHPSGYYLAVGLQDQLKVFHLMHDDFRLFHCFDIKKSSKLKFSQGGHLLVVATDKHVYFISTYGLEVLSKLDSPSSLVTCLAFNANDSILSLTSSNGFHQRYDIVNLKKRGEAFIDKSINYRSVVFL